MKRMAKVPIKVRYTVEMLNTWSMIGIDELVEFITFKKFTQAGRSGYTTHTVSKKKKLIVLEVPLDIIRFMLFSHLDDSEYKR